MISRHEWMQKSDNNKKITDPPFPSVFYPYQPFLEFNKILENKRKISFDFDISNKKYQKRRKK